MELSRVEVICSRAIMMTLRYDFNYAVTYREAAGTAYVISNYSAQLPFKCAPLRRSRDAPLFSSKNHKSENSGLGLLYSLAANPEANEIRGARDGRAFSWIRAR